MRLEADLVSAARRGDVGAFDQLYDRYSARLFDYLTRLTGDPALAEDILQESFIRVLEDDRSEFRSGSFSAWLFTVGRNLALSEHRARSRRSLQRASLPSETDTPSFERAAARRDALSKALGQRDFALQDAVLLKAVAGLTYLEIGLLQGIPEGTVKSRVHSALHALRHRLTQDDAQ